MNQYEKLAQQAFNIISLLEVCNISDKNFMILRKKLLDLGNDILRLGVKQKGCE